MRKAFLVLLFLFALTGGVLADGSDPLPACRPPLKPPACQPQPPAVALPQF